LKQLAPFKSVKITTDNGSTPDRVVLNVEVEEQQTGDLSFSGGYSTSLASSARSAFRSGIFSAVGNT